MCRFTERGGSFDWAHQLGFATRRLGRSAGAAVTASAGGGGAVWTEG